MIPTLLMLIAVMLGTAGSRVGSRALSASKESMIFGYHGPQISKGWPAHIRSGTPPAVHLAELQFPAPVASALVATAAPIVCAPVIAVVVLALRRLVAKLC